MAAVEKTVQYTKRGLKVVGPKSIFDLEEPPWIPDEKVSLFKTFHARIFAFNDRCMLV